METSRFHLRQIPGYRMFFGFLILFTCGALGEETSTILDTKSEQHITVLPSIAGSSSNAEFPSTEIPAEKPATGTDSEVSSKANTNSKLLVAMSKSRETTPVSTLPLEQLSTAKHLKADTTTEQKVPAMDNQIKQVDTTASIHTSASPEQLSTAKHLKAPQNKTFDITTEQKVHAVDNQTKQAAANQTKEVDTTASIHTSASPERTTTVLSTTAKAETIKVVGESHTTVGESVSSRTTAATVRSTDLKPRSRKGKNETSTTPGQRVQDDPTAHGTSSQGTETWYTAETSKSSTGGAMATTVHTPHQSPTKDSKGVIVAVILSILLLMVLLVALLFCWRRRRSGSTSFQSAGWAGQAVLPDDSGLDKELDQGAPTTGEGQTKSVALTTFFGKRQSRIPSIAMEEVIQKKTGDIEEGQPLIDGNASGVSCMEGSGEANGKLPESAAQGSQEKELSLPPANQEETPPPKLE